MTTTLIETELSRDLAIVCRPKNAITYAYRIKGPAADSHPGSVKLRWK
jgi:hypothetical protein